MSQKKLKTMLLQNFLGKVYYGKCESGELLHVVNSKSSLLCICFSQMI